MPEMIVEKSPNYESYINKTIAEFKTNYTLHCIAVVRTGTMTKLEVRLRNAKGACTILVAAANVGGEPLNTAFASAGNAAAFFKSLLDKD